MATTYYTFPSLTFETPQLTPTLYNTSSLQKSFPSLTKPTVKTGSLAATGVGIGANILSSGVSNNLFDDSDSGRIMGTLFSSGVSSIGETIGNNLIKGSSLTKGLTSNLASSVAGAGAGLAANYLGQGITSALGDSRTARGIGSGISTGLGAVGGTALSGTISSTSSAAEALSSINPYALGMNVIGSALGGITGSSKEYSGKYGNITQGMDTAYDIATIGANAIPGGQVISGVMALNKGLSNIFGSTDGMTQTDAILGSAFMPAPIKWLNVLGSSKTDTFDNQSWQNSEKTRSFMGNAFGNLQDRFDQASSKAGKTYGTFSQGAKRDAQDNINFANKAWEKILKMTDQNEIQNIKSQYMNSINNQKYAQNIQGGLSLVGRGKLGMKILNNATNHTIGMRLLSGAALIDNKQILLSKCRDLD